VRLYDIEDDNVADDDIMVLCKMSEDDSEKLCMRNMVKRLGTHKVAEMFVAARKRFRGERSGKEDEGNKEISGARYKKMRALHNERGPWRVVVGEGEGEGYLMWEEDGEEEKGPSSSSRPSSSWQSG
jgi:hypothetical protein